MGRVRGRAEGWSGRVGPACVSVAGIASGVSLAVGLSLCLPEAAVAQSEARVGGPAAASAATAALASTAQDTPSPVSVPKADCRLVRGPRRAVVAVLDGETVRLDDGQEVRIIGILAPRKPAPPVWSESQMAPPRPGDEKSALTGAAETPAPWPLNGRAKSALEQLVLGRSVQLRFERLRRDRYGRTLAHLFVDSDRPPPAPTGSGAEPAATRGQTPGTWVAGALLAGGYVRAAGAADTRNCARSALAAERLAREARRGLWTHAAYAVRSARDERSLLAFRQTFQVVEGRVAKVARVGRRTFINFADDWRSDFTLVIEGRRHRTFDRLGIDLEALAGRRVRARGWVEVWNGPLIRVTHPEQIELAGRRGGLPRRKSEDRVQAD